MGTNCGRYARNARFHMLVGGVAVMLISSDREHGYQIALLVL
jgi:hypothetical protein